MNYVEAFARKKRHRRNGVIAFLLSEFILTSAIGQMTSDRIGLITFLLVFVVFAAYLWWDWTCPACRKRLPQEFWKGSCPHCGEQLSA